MSETTAEDLEQEEWQSLVKGSRGLNYWLGRERRMERVDGGAIFYISPEERRRNQQMVRDKRNDDFTNGAFLMRACVESDAESKRLYANKTAKPDTELVKLLDSTSATFTKKLAEIKEPVTAERLYRMARRNDIGGAKLKAIVALVKELDPHAVVVGDKLAEGRENPEDESKGPTPDIELDGDPGPRTYAGV